MLNPRRRNPLWLRLIIVAPILVIGPIVLFWTFVGTLALCGWRELGFAWSRTRREIASIPGIWRNTEFRDRE